MKGHIAICFAAALGFSAHASAQQANSPVGSAAGVQQTQLSAEQQAQLARQNEEMSNAAAQVMKLVDEQRSAEVWEGASVVAKKSVTKEQFVENIASDREMLGAVVGRKHVTVTRAVYPVGGPLPAGNYVSVVTATKFAKSEQEVRELVSFHLDDDATWRVTGYSLR